MTEHITGIPAVGVPVTDQERALRFYTETLGMEKRLDVPLEQFGGRWITVAPSGSATSIALIPAHDGLPAGVETGIRLGTADAAALHAGLQHHGVDVGELLRWEGVPPMFAFRDPDGNGLEVTQKSQADPARVSTVKRGILIACCTFATALGSLAVASPAAADGCPYGTVPTRFPGVCTGGQAGSAAPPAITVPPQGAGVVTMPGQFATINGIPCNQRHFGTCYAMSQQP